MWICVCVCVCEWVYVWTSIDWHCVHWVNTTTKTTEKTWYYYCQRQIANTNSGGTSVDVDFIVVNYYIGPLEERNPEITPSANTTHSPITILQRCIWMLNWTHTHKKRATTIVEQRKYAKRMCTNRNEFILSTHKNAALQIRVLICIIVVCVCVSRELSVRIEFSTK